MVKVPKLITPEECTSILQKHFGDPNFTLLNFTFRPLSEGVEGFLGEHYIITSEVLRNSQTLKVTFFAKIAPYQHELMMEYVRAGMAFEKEEFLYEVLIKNFCQYCPSFDASILPKFYFNRNNDIVVMENLQEKGFQVAPFKDTMDYPHIKLILKTLSKFHSGSLIYEEKRSEELGRPYRLVEGFDEMFTEGFFQEDPNFLGHKWHVASRKGVMNTISLMDIIPDPEGFKEKFFHLTEKCVEIVKPTSRFRNVATHGDLWLKNVLFRYETSGTPVECRLIDFQLLKYNPPAFDVLKIIYQSTTSEQRQKYFDDFVKYYYDCLCKELSLGGLEPSKILSRDEFYASINFMLPQCKVETLYYYTYQKFGPDFLKQLMSRKEDFKTFTFGDRTQWMLEYYKPGSVYKKWVDEMMIEIRDMLLHDVTREDIHSILRMKYNTIDYTLLDYKTFPVLEKTGFMGEYLKLQVNIKLHNNRQEEVVPQLQEKVLPNHQEVVPKIQEEVVPNYFFLKIVPQNSYFASTNFTITSGAFSNERFIYDRVFSKMKLFHINIHEVVPNYFISRKDDVIVLEDLTAEGFRLANKRVPFSLDELKIVIKNLAKFHATSFQLEEALSRVGNGNFQVTQYQDSIKETFFVKTNGHLGYEMTKCAVKGLEKLMEMFPSGSGLLETFRGFYDKAIFDQVRPSMKYRNVICHGDLWANNILMKYDGVTPVDCRFVDLQSVRICPPAHDVMSLIYLTTTRAFRKNHLMEILELYYQELEKILCSSGNEAGLPEVLPQDVFLESCNEYKLFAINFAAISFPFIMITNEDMSNIISNEDLSKKIWFEDCTNFILETCKKDAFYKKVLMDSIEDLRELCEEWRGKFILDI